MQHFGQHLRELRLKKGISSQETASYLGIDPVVINHFESGRVIPSKYQVLTLAGCFNVDTKGLLIAYQKQRMLNEEVLESGHIKSRLIKNREVATRRYQNMKQEFDQLSREGLHIKVHKPAYPLNKYIENMTYYDGHNFNCASEKIFPDGTVKLFIELDSHKRQLKPGNGTLTGIDVKNSWITGIQKQHLAYQLKPTQTILSVQFHPGGFHALTGIPQTDLENTVVDTEAVFGPSIIEFRDRILEEKEVQGIFAKAENYFKMKIRDPGTEYEVITYVCNHIDDSLSSLVRKSGYSHKHFISLFKKLVGITPKYFQRIARFNRVLNDIHAKKREIDWAGISIDNHYFDQAHFIKEFNHFSGISPGSYLETGSTCSKLLYQAQ